MVKRNKLVIESKYDQELGDNRVLRRYLDLAKFIDLLRTKRLYLRRADLLTDKFEGSFTPEIKAALVEAYQLVGEEGGYEKLRRRLRHGSYINCWTLGLHDNMAMWAIYGKSNASVAITTTVGKLKKELEKSTLTESIKVYKVEYVNHWKDPKISLLPFTNVFKYKLAAYTYEQEVRVVFNDNCEDFDDPAKAEGIYLDVCLKNLLRTIVVSPDAEPWFVEQVKDLVRIYGLETEVNRSKLSGKPY